MPSTNADSPPSAGRHPSRAAAVLLLIIAAAIWSTSGAFLKSLPDVHWMAVAGVRSVFASLLFLPGLVQPRPPLRKLLPAIFIYIFVVGALMGSMQLGTAAQGIWLQYIAPAVVALYAFLIRRERLRLAEVIAVLLVLIAVAFIVAGGRGVSHHQSVFLGILSGFAFGFFILLLKSLADVSASSIYVWTNLGTAAVLIPTAVALHIPLPTAPRDLTLLAIMGMGQLAFAYHLFQRGLVATRAVEASLIILLEPILNPVWVYLIVGELPSTRVIIGCALIAVGLVAFALSPRRAA